MKNSLSHRLEQIFSDLGINQIDFSRKTGFGQSYISQILNGGKTSPSSRFYDTVSRAYNINSEWLKTGKGEIYVSPDADGEDAEILAKYRLLPAAEQHVIEEMINALLDKAGKAKKK